MLLILILLSAISLVHSHVEERPRDGLSESQGTLSQIRKIGFEARQYNLKVLEEGQPELKLYRIINPLADKSTLYRFPVLYGHGILFDAHSMITKSDMSRPRKPKIGQPTILYQDGHNVNDYSLPFMLSNNNFDVWLYDARAAGSQMPDLSKHNGVKRAQQYWNFSLDEQALEDLPNMINFVLTKTNTEKIAYVGFSESTLFMFALLSTQPEMADKLVSFVALAPVTYVSYMQGLAGFGILPYGFIMPSIHTRYNFMAQKFVDMVNNLITNLCHTRVKPIHMLCDKVVNSLGGNGDAEHDRKFLRNLYKSTSLNSIRHFSQILVRGRFAMYDYGRKENMRHYGKPNPPLYNLTKITYDRMILVRGGKDLLATPEGARRLLSEIGSKPYLDIYIPDYGHFSVIDGHNLIENVNEPIVRALHRMMYREPTPLTANLTFSFESQDLAGSQYLST